jgi:uncharacterized membrane protein YuzA (DUF378 family)
MKTTDLIAAIFLFVGGINWGLVALFDFNLVKRLFDGMNTLTNVAYCLVAISAIYVAVMWMPIQRRSEMPQPFGQG